MIASRRKALLLGIGAAEAALTGCVQRGAATETDSGPSPDQSASERKSVHIIATGDLHGRFLPWDYYADAEDLSGSMAQLAAAIQQRRESEGAILVDAGDAIHDNLAEVFAREAPDEPHPMIACMNAMRYDIAVPGDHEFNYGMDYLRKSIASFEGTTLLANVTDERGEALASGYRIIEWGDVRIGFIGVVTPAIRRYDAANFRGCRVASPIAKTQALIKQLAPDVDALVAICHMGMEREFDLKTSGLRDLAKGCPELDLIIAAHDGVLHEGEDIEGVFFVANDARAKTAIDVELELEQSDDGWSVVTVASDLITSADAEPDADIAELMAPHDKRAKDYAHEVIGKLEGVLAPRVSFAGCPATMTSDTALVDLINAVQLHYSGADVSATALVDPMARLAKGSIRRCDIAKIWPSYDTLYLLEMSGAQLKHYIEWAARFYKGWEDGDLTIAFDPDLTPADYDIFSGVNYQIDLSCKKGSRVRNLEYEEGKRVKNDDVLKVVVNGRRAKDLLTRGVVYKGTPPKLLRVDVKRSVGDLREMIADYIGQVSAGSLKPERDNNWQVTGTSWDGQEHRKAMQQLYRGDIKLWSEEDLPRLIDVAVTADDLME